MIRLPSFDSRENFEILKIFVDAGEVFCKMASGLNENIMEQRQIARKKTIRYVDSEGVEHATLAEAKLRELSKIISDEAVCRSILENAETIIAILRVKVKGRPAGMIKKRVKKKNQATGPELFPGPEATPGAEATPERATAGEGA